MLPRRNRKVCILTNSDCLLLVNRSHPLDADFVPTDLVYCRIPWDVESPAPLQKQYLTREAAIYMELLCAYARQYSVYITGISGYRSYHRQKELYDSAVTRTFLAPPGTSEHQTGLAIDLSTPDIANRLGADFEHTDAYRFLMRNGARYGFILRFPRGREHLTGYPFESWHFRYVGRTAAQEITEAGICLEEYVR